jgi:hypothetical protein
VFGSIVKHGQGKTNLVNGKLSKKKKKKIAMEKL